MEITNQDIIAGTTLEWEEYFDDFPSSDYDSECALKKGSGSPLIIEATASTETTNGFSYLADHEESANYPNGSYDFQFIFTSKTDGKKYAPRKYSGSVIISALLSSSQDTRSDDQKVLDSLKVQRQKIAERDYTSMGSNGKQAQFKALKEIDADIARYEAKLGYRVNPIILNSF